MNTCTSMCARNRPGGDMNAISSSVKQHKALVVNDSVLERTWLTKVLSAGGYFAQQASSLDNVVGWIEREQIDLVLCSSELEAVNVFNLCSAIHGAKFDFFVYVIVLGQQASERLCIQALQAGADEFISKPVDRSELALRLGTASRIIDLQKRYFALRAAMPTAMQRLSTDMRAMAQFQTSLLPNKGQDIQGLFYDHFWLPKVFVSGDLFQVLPLNEQWAGFYVFDVVGHGVPAALRALDLYRLLSANPHDGILLDQQDLSFVQRVRMPNEVLADLNARFQMTREGDVYFCITYGVMHVHTGEVFFSSAGSPCPMVQHLDGQFSVEGDSDLPIGVVPDTDYALHQFKVEAGERLFLYSDGLTQVMDEAGNALEQGGLMALLTRYSMQDLARQVQQVREGVAYWTSGKPANRVLDDDCSLLALQWKEAERDSAPSVATDHDSPDVAVGDSDPADPPLDVPEDRQTTEPEFQFARRKENSRVVLLRDAGASPELPEWLQTWGYTLVVSDNPAECAAVLQAQAVTFLLFDVQRWTPAHADLIESGRRAGKNPSLYVLLVSNPAIQADWMTCLKDGVDNITTPVHSAREIYTRLATGLRLADIHKRFTSDQEQADTLHQEVQEDMERIAAMQLANLPAQRQYPPRLQLDCLFQPAHLVSNQMMNVMPLKDGLIAFFHVTAQGSGLVGVARGLTFFRRLTDAVNEDRSTLSRYMNTSFSPAAVLTELNAWVYAERSQDSQFALCYGVLDPNTGEARISHAGYPMAIVTRARGGIEQLGAYGPPLGVSPDATFQDVFFSLGAGDRLFLFSGTLNEHPAMGDDFVENKEKLFESSVSVGFDDLRPHLQSALLKPARRLPLQAEREAVDISLLMFQWGEHVPLVFEACSAPVLRDIEGLLQTALSDDMQSYDKAWQLAMPVNADLIPELSDRLADVLRILGVDEEQVANIQLCLFEMTSNVCRHSGLGLDDTLQVQVMKGRGGLLLKLTDRGVPIPDSTLAQAEVHDFEFDVNDDAAIPLGGMGLALVHSLTSRFETVRIDEHNHTLMWF
ncbi:SpoIIE family protein phosphatase [Limnobacter humi]|uniref:SpoIIE family protein phosphatase n=1 Tax=Limnobacter humi TaxID=1778671 RepID=A0ABT1WBY6_9BURK|nr:SpoIIE family protein phosphatase [Limnobacter humi]MCQ8895024.1 SpoIIE family protein phosphatase [Limnobacter humi]